MRRVGDETKRLAATPTRASVVPDLAAQTRY